MWGLILIGVAICVIGWVTGALLLGIPGMLLILWGVFALATGSWESSSS